MSENGEGTARPEEADAVESAFEVLAAGRPGDAERLLDAGGAELRRDVELLGLLAYEIEPEAPHPGLKERLLTQVLGDETRMINDFVPPSEEPPEAATQAPENATATIGPVEPAATGGRLPAWATLLAAVLAICVVGLGGLSWVLGQQIEEQRAALASQRQQLDRLAAAVDVAEARTVALSALEQELAAVRSRFEIVTGAATEVCTLAPPEEGAPAPAARAVLYVAADHQHWYLKARGLDEATPGHIYQLWFLADEPVSAGTFEVASDEVELSSATMPAGTRAVFITLEAEAEPQPSGPVVLYGDDVMRLL